MKNIIKGISKKFNFEKKGVFRCPKDRHRKNQFQRITLQQYFFLSIYPYIREFIFKNCYNMNV